jgi:hypothetical protein
MEHTSKDIANLLAAAESNHDFLPSIITSNEALRFSNEIGKLGGRQSTDNRQ